MWCHYTVSGDHFARLELRHCRRDQDLPYDADVMGRREYSGLGRAECGGRDGVVLEGGVDGGRQSLGRAR